MSHRIARINEAVREVLNRAVREVKDPRVREALVSVSAAEVSGDLSVAKIYVSVLAGDEAEAVRGMNAARGFLRTYLARELDLRKTPALTFVRDTSAERGAHVAELLRQIEQEQKEQ